MEGAWPEKVKKKKFLWAGCGHEVLIVLNTSPVIAHIEAKPINPDLTCPMLALMPGFLELCQSLVDVTFDPFHAPAWQRELWAQREQLWRWTHAGRTLCCTIGILVVGKGAVLDPIT